MANQSELEGIRRQLQELPLATAPEALQARVMDTLAQLDSAPTIIDLNQRRHWIRRPAWQAGLALAACSAMLFLWFFWLGERPPVADQGVPQVALNVQPPAPDPNASELARLQAASADLERVLLSEQPNDQVYGDDQAWVEQTLQAALHRVDADLAAQPDEDERVELWTQRVALLAGLAEQSRGMPLGSGVEWVQLN
ncbi:MAG: hypothetical protein KDI71_05845 [Xanthomonadales bacterium]|nr:hypothetical protein [Xanthomonadales bacterium]